MSKKAESDSSHNSREEGEMNKDNKFLFEALRAELGKMLTQQMEDVHERITRENEERLHRNRDERRRHDPLIFQRGGGRGGRGGRGGGNFHHEDRHSEAEFEDEEDARSEFDERQPRGRDSDTTNKNAETDG